MKITPGQLKKQFENKFKGRLNFSKRKEGSYSKKETRNLWGSYFECALKNELISTRKTENQLKKCFDNNFAFIVTIEKNQDGSYTNKRMNDLWSGYLKCAADNYILKKD